MWQGIQSSPDLRQRGNLQIQKPMVKSTEMAHVQEMQSKLFGASTQILQRPSTGVQVSAPVPTRWGLQHAEGPKPIWFPAAQNISFGHNSHKMVHGQASGLVQKGRTISDIKTLESNIQTRQEIHSIAPKAWGHQTSKRDLSLPSTTTHRFTWMETKVSSSMDYFCHIIIPLVFIWVVVLQVRAPDNLFLTLMIKFLFNAKYKRIKGSVMHLHDLAEQNCSSQVASCAPLEFLSQEELLVHHVLKLFCCRMVILTNH
ncbi:uncharacterized protein LOC132635637 isoform X1 [Lycium barbarum]|uniref:uncharacterized protein LOC132635637 isoform X1 n=1 Tax=Lycium barbarum TaxID=112863 RepID=UPI00293F3CB5|nr:uncharacterized protein LOC132635637 isoform X1 [Lycium barbarum]XP_060208083.1 uncharacterized protein LOC132635637 isoform X1 [Lycium barbarum]XP_060208084.1 uncharacterized protein LOC132635637 isoform X1 [Lycium barbarum]XP_060208085.1 uncharacterized protein LOC132635637 isoform X1 [Lycium barbarum]XP_060208086.1 uncharacterized protein LOC132635637 isoform X1 [Lycium barbarum]XP_060208088.1 uncharacterized protein LOC132635637 isoform X1 [Lycium barbarum]XP_060208089.1 uncharacterize